MREDSGRGEGWMLRYGCGASARGEDGVTVGEGANGESLVVKIWED